MKTAGIIGGIASESTVDYYRSIIRLYRERKQDGSYPPIIINSIDLNKMLGMAGAGEFAALTDYLVREVRRLSDAGADFGLFASNTPHVVFEDVRQKASIPMLSIVEAACRAAGSLGLKNVGIFGTSLTMQGRFYPDVFSQHGINISVPDVDDLNYIHDKYMHELVNGVFLPETREGLLAIADRLKERKRIDGLILGGTELPLLLRDVALQGIPFLDTTRIHVEEVVSRMLHKELDGFLKT